MLLELDNQEQETLAEVLQIFLSELRTEVAHTDRLAYRERLKDQEKLIQKVLGRLEG